MGGRDLEKKTPGDGGGVPPGAGSSVDPWKTIDARWATRDIRPEFEPTLTVGGLKACVDKPVD